MRTGHWTELLVLFCLVIAYIPVNDALLCYQCADSTGNREKADCMHNVSRLFTNRELHLKENRPLNKLNYLKNCSHYVDNYFNERFTYCQITTVESFGTINAFIRDCSDRQNFAAQLNVTRLQFVRADNQTTCGYSQLQGATICVRLCDTDFCNGPSASGNDVRVSHALLLGAIFCVAILLNNRLVLD